jgi:hypothetical protein
MEIKITAPIILDMVLRNVRKESVKLESERMSRPGQVNEVRTSQLVVECVDIFGKSVHDTAKRLRTIKWSVGGESSRFNSTYCCLKKGHWAVHDAADSILPEH